jgi:thiol-disulfide isomerase/thioredoxin
VKLLFVLAAACGGAAPVPAGPPPAKELQVNTTGAPIELGQVLVADYVTIIDFWSESCGACVTVGAMVTTKIADQPRVVMRKVDVGDGFNDLAKAFEINALPHYNVYDRKRRLRYILVGNDCLRAPDLARKLVAEP